MFLSSATLVASFVPVLQKGRLPSRVRRPAFLLSTSFEWLAVERAMDTPYGNFSWFSPTERPIENEQDGKVMPLYPLGACYMPSNSTNYTLNNVEPRNIQMAQDLSEGGRFCAVLCASDTGRLASVGTVMRVVELEPYEQAGVLRRITIRCCAERLVDICSIVNPEASSLESRLRRSREYLKARVKSKSMAPCGHGESEAIASQIIDHYDVVRSAYLEGDGARDLPPFALRHLTEALPPWTVDDLVTEQGFWTAAEVWQTLCSTVREGRQMALSADRNELMVAAAAAKGGPLKLPIHASDLSPADRFQLQELERQAQSDFVALGLDPCLDFQVLLGMTSPIDRLTFLSRMIARERRRLDAMPSESLETKGNSDELQRKGAWFEGFE